VAGRFDQKFGKIMVSSEAFIPEQTAHQPALVRTVRFELCYSVLIATVRWQSALRPTRSPWQRLWLGWPYAVASLLLGPWGLPWGPIWTAVAVWHNLTGGIADDPGGVSEVPPA
jgi:hypothetical protein